MGDFGWRGDHRWKYTVALRGLLPALKMYILSNNWIEYVDNIAAVNYAATKDEGVLPR